MAERGLAGKAAGDVPRLPDEATKNTIIPTFTR
jgi:hypothetical protein